VATDRDRVLAICFDKGGWRDPAERGKPGVSSCCGCTKVLRVDVPTSKLRQDDFGHSMVGEVEYCIGPAR